MSTNVNDAPLLQQYSWPSGPTARPFGPPPGSADGLLRAVRADPGDAPVLHLDEHDAAVAHPDRALREPEPARDLRQLSHSTLQLGAT
jgi:hypothetical protein